MRPSPILLPVAWGYHAIIRLRNRAYDSGVFSSVRAGIPVISVGNITAGGTGKTPFVEYLVRKLNGVGKRVAILSRGYGRQGREPVEIGPEEPNRGNALMMGDEPYQMARKFVNTAVLVDAKRVRAAGIAIDRFHSDVVVLDDGFQHRALARDLDIVMINGSIPVREMRFLPVGLKREPLGSLRRANLIAYTGDENMQMDGGKELVEGIPSIRIGTRARSLHSIHSGKECPPEELRGKVILAFCGIGNPLSFRRTLEKLGAVVRGLLTFGDHHAYTDADLREIKREYVQGNVELVVTTEKDAVRLDGVLKEILPHGAAYYLEIESEVTQGKEILDSMIDTLFRDRAS